MDYYKMMVPSQFIAERGSDIVVINPGSANLRVGLGSTQSPLVVPHVVAWQHKKEESEMDDAEPQPKGAVGESKYVRSSMNASKIDERDDCLDEIEMQLRVHPTTKEEERNWQRKLDSLDVSNPDIDFENFMWTDVKPELEADTGQTSQTMPKFICGDEALRIPSIYPYSLRRPICRGRFNASEQYSFQQVCDDICVIWEWVLTSKLGLHANQRKQFSVVLVVPDTLDSREIKELITIVLRDLHFSSAVVHQECVAITFGSGASSGCIVNVGAQVTNVICVEEGVVFPITKVVLPFGGEDISRCLLWLQKRLNTWPPVDCDPIANPVDMLMLNKLKEKYCTIEDGDNRACLELQFHNFNCETQKYKVILAELNVPPMGLFFPALIAPDEYVPLTRPWYHTDSEDIVLDDAGIPFGTEQIENSIYGIGRQSRIRNEERLMGLSEAIVKSILLARIDLQKKLFSSIQLAGGGASTRGLIDALEERVLQAIPMHESIDTVEVLPPRMDTSIVAWKGGVILGILDFSRDTWVQRDDWVGGGLRIGAGKKYKDSFFLQTHAFWYTSS